MTDKGHECDKNSQAESAAGQNLTKVRCVVASEGTTLFT